MSRYEDCDDSLVEVFLEVLEERFPAYVNLKFRLIYDTKKRINKGKICLASIELASPKIKFFTKDEKAIEGYDYVLIVDQKAWQYASDADKRRIISHELRHVFIDEKGTPKIIDHDINDFYSEIKLNTDDPDWGLKLCTLVSAIYEQEKDDKKGANM